MIDVTQQEVDDLSRFIDEPIQPPSWGFRFCLNLEQRGFRGLLCWCALFLAALVLAHSYFAVQDLYPDLDSVYGLFTLGVIILVCAATPVFVIGSIPLLLLFLLIFTPQFGG